MALSFGGSFDAARVVGASPAITTTPLTISCWCRPVTVAVTQTLVAVCNTPGSAFNSFYLELNKNTPDFGASIAAGGSFGGAFAGSPAINTWFHVVGVYRSGTNRQIYVDGVPGPIDTANLVPSSLTQTALGAFVGTTPPSSYMDGLVAEAGIWNRALTDPEIVALSKGFAPSCLGNGLIWYVPGWRTPTVEIYGMPLTETGPVGVGEHLGIIYPDKPPSSAGEGSAPPPVTYENWYARKSEAVGVQ